MGDSLKAREVVLVGGSGGIGTALTAALVEEGASVILSYRSRGDRARTWDSVARVVQADVVVAADRTRLLDLAPSLYGLVILAGDPARVTEPAQTEAAMLQSHRTNYQGPILLAREAAARMKAANAAGAIVLVSTMQANALFPGSTVYAAQKAALQHAARLLAREYRGSANIRVNVVSPGVTAAGMAEASIAAGKYNHFLQDDVIGRFGRAEDVARAIRFFLEPDDYITGQILCVDGGITL